MFFVVLSNGTIINFAWVKSFVAEGNTIFIEYYTGEKVNIGTYNSNKEAKSEVQSIRKAIKEKETIYQMNAPRLDKFKFD